MNSKYHLTQEIKPEVNLLGNIAFTDLDLVFDWTAFEIPRGTCNMRALTMKIKGTLAADGNHDIDLNLYFAKSIDGVAPPSLGGSNTAPTVIAATAARPWIMAFHKIDASASSMDASGLISYNLFSQENRPDVIIEGDPAYSTTTSGYQTIWVAAIARGALDFGSDVLVAGEHSADDLTIVVDGTPGGDDMFAIGDTITAFAADGSAPKVIGNLTAVADDLLTVDAAPVVLPDDHEICNLNPITFTLGLEY